ncbi:MAG TPA: class I tRNA ligase family protein, partial [Patescibacteria group bacterium]
IIVAEALLSQVDATAKVLKTFPGSELIGATYESPYQLSLEEGVDRVVFGEHVTAESGTGIASIAPAYGEVDSQVGKRESLPMVQTIRPDGTLKSGMNLPGEGLFMKEANKAIISDLDQRGFLVRQEVIHHTYPFCWRCDSPLLYFPTTSWYIAVTKIKDALVAENEKINWLPTHLRDGRFGNWLEGARDWAVSRDRFWGAPMPIWECPDCDKIKVVHSIKDIEVDNAFDLHRPKIDKVTLPCACGGTMKRVPFVFDCWFESGSMPYAQHHYPFEHSDQFNPERGTGYPADFIAEALDQTRGWFYTLHVLGVALFGQRAYKNVVTSGLILASDGKKLSKRLRNYTDPEVVFSTIGADALRLFLFTAASIGEDYRFSDAAVNDVKRRWITPLLNSVQYYHLSLPQCEKDKAPSAEHALLDEWIKARVAQARYQVTEYMDGDDTHSPFDLARACRVFGPLVEDLSTWYIRLSRGRTDQAFTETLQAVLVKISTTFAPFLPFLTEHIYQAVKLSDPKFPESVHLCTLRSLDEWKNESIINEMELARKVVSLGRDARVKVGIPVRQPLRSLIVTMQADAELNLSEPVKDLVAQELQVDKVVVEKNASSDSMIMVTLDSTLTEDLRNRGMANLLRRTVQDLRKQAALQPGDAAVVSIPELDDSVSMLLRDQLGQTELVQEAYSGEVIGHTEITEGERSLDITLYSR